MSALPPPMNLGGDYPAPCSSATSSAPPPTEKQRETVVDDVLLMLKLQHVPPRRLPATAGSTPTTGGPPHVASSPAATMSRLLLDTGISAPLGEKAAVIPTATKDTYAIQMVKENSSESVFAWKSNSATFSPEGGEAPPAADSTSTQPAAVPSLAAAKENSGSTFAEHSQPRVVAQEVKAVPVSQLRSTKRPLHRRRGAATSCTGTNVVEVVLSTVQGPHQIGTPHHHDSPNMRPVGGGGASNGSTPPATPPRVQMNAHQFPPPITNGGQDSGNTSTGTSPALMSDRSSHPSLSPPQLPQRHTAPLPPAVESGGLGTPSGAAGVPKNPHSGSFAIDENNCLSPITVPGAVGLKRLAFKYYTKPLSPHELSFYAAAISSRKAASATPNGTPAAVATANDSTGFAGLALPEAFVVDNMMLSRGEGMIHSGSGSNLARLTSMETGSSGPTPSTAPSAQNGSFPSVPTSTASPTVFNVPILPSPSTVGEGTPISPMSGSCCKGLLMKVFSHSLSTLLLRPDTSAASALGFGASASNSNMTSPMQLNGGRAPWASGASPNQLGGGLQEQEEESPSDRPVFRITREYYYVEDIDVLASFAKLLIGSVAKMENLPHRFQGKVYKGFAHNDIKLDNILLDKKTGLVSVCDFEFVAHVGEEDVLHNEFESKLPYAHCAPEGLGSKSDVWAAGLLILELFVGIHPIIDGGAATDDFNEGPLLAPDSEEAPGIDWKNNLREHVMTKCRKFLDNKKMHALDDFLGLCLCNDPQHRPTATALLSHPFINLVESTQKAREHVSKYVNTMLQVRMSDAIFMMLRSIPRLPSQTVLLGRSIGTGGNHGGAVVYASQIMKQSLWNTNTTLSHSPSGYNFLGGSMASLDDAGSSNGQTDSASSPPPPGRSKVPPAQFRDPLGNFSSPQAPPRLPQNGSSKSLLTRSVSDKELMAQKGSVRTALMNASFEERGGDGRTLAYKRLHDSRLNFHELSLMHTYAKAKVDASSLTNRLSKNKFSLPTSEGLLLPEVLVIDKIDNCVIAQKLYVSGVSGILMPKMTTSLEGLMVQTSSRSSSVASTPRAACRTPTQAGATTPPWGSANNRVSTPPAAPQLLNMISPRSGGALTPPQAPNGGGFGCNMGGERSSLRSKQNFDGIINLDVLRSIAFLVLRNLKNLRHAPHTFAGSDYIGYTHNDLKMDNVLVRRSDGEVVLCDFELVGHIKNEGQFEPYLVNKSPKITPTSHRAPEGYGTRSDSWAVGILMVELATGVHPFIDASVAMDNFGAGPHWSVMPDPDDEDQDDDEGEGGGGGGFDVDGENPLDWANNMGEHARSICPTIAQSTEFDGFLEAALTNIVKRRWTPEQLLQHPFVHGMNATLAKTTMKQFIEEMIPKQAAATSSTTKPKVASPVVSAATKETLQQAGLVKPSPL